jgi:hypothetical protein
VRRDEPSGLIAAVGRRKLPVVATAHAQPRNREPSLELPVEELMRRARPLPSPEEMAIDELTSDEGQAFLVAVNS